MPSNDTETPKLFMKLLEIVKVLRSPDGCPWDREQTPATIAPYLIEEAHEVQEAVENGNPGELCDELGDVMLEVALLSQMASEKGEFTIADSLQAVCAKLVRRHPHVFGDASCDDAEAVMRLWADIKAEEKKDRGAVDGVPRKLPALLRARRVSEKASGAGFDWSGPEQVMDKIEEEVLELKTAVSQNNRAEAEEEIGDLLFAVVNLARHIHANPETLLNRATQKFIDRFSVVESRLAEAGRKPSDADVEELEALWQEAKEKVPRNN